jgi:hypothetical protein
MIYGFARNVHPCSRENIALSTNLRFEAISLQDDEALVNTQSKQNLCVITLHGFHESSCWTAQPQKSES